MEAVGPKGTGQLQKTGGPAWGCGGTAWRKGKWGWWGALGFILGAFGVRRRNVLPFPAPSCPLTRMPHDVRGQRAVSCLPQDSPSRWVWAGCCRAGKGSCPR